MVCSFQQITFGGMVESVKGEGGIAWCMLIEVGAHRGRT